MTASQLLLLFSCTEFVEVVLSRVVEGRRGTISDEVGGAHSAKLVNPTLDKASGKPRKRSVSNVEVP